MAQQFQLTSAKVMGDGQIVRLQYEAGVAVGQPALNRLTDTGIADYLPGLASGLSVSVNDATAEIIGVQAEDWNMPLPWILVPTNDGTLTAGSYYFLITIQDAAGVQKYVGPPIIAYQGDSGEVPTVIYAGQSVTFRWRVPVPVGGSLNIYACTALPLYGNLARVASIPYASLTNPTQYKLTAFGGDNAVFAPQSVTWTATARLATPVPLGATVSIAAPAGLLSDEKGNATAAAASVLATNNSVMGSNGFLATPENATATSGTFSYTRTVYISYSQGTNAVGNGTLTNPYKTMGYAISQTASGKNVRFRFLRGDTWPADTWNRAYWGTGLSTPTLFESYWNPSYGTDPGTRPVITVSDPYYDMTTKNLDATAVLWQQFTDTTGTTVGNGDRPYIYFRGLAFRADPLYPNTFPVWPTTTFEDFVVISDCEFQNVCLVGTYGVPMKVAPVGNLMHRTTVHSVHGSPINTSADVGSGGTSLVLPDRFMNPWAGYASSGSNLIIPGQTFVRFFSPSGRWRITNWKVTATEGALSETKTLTTHGDSNGSYWNVSTPWSNTFTRAGVALSLDPTGQQFQILAGTGAGATVYTVSAYNAANRTATVSPALPTVDLSTRIAFLPMGYWDTAGHIQGIYLAHCGDWLFSQSTFDKNGWNWHDDTATYNDVYCHNLYLSGMCRDIVTHGCYVLRAGSVGLQQRGGGVFAYNVFAENTHGSNMLGGGTVYKNLFTGQGLYNFSLSTPPSHLPGLLHDFNLVLKSHGSLENRVPSQNYTGVTALNCNEYTYGHSYFGVRHGTFVDAGSVFLGLRVPVPNKLQVRNNLLANRAGTGVDYLGNPLQTSVLNLQANWQNNGIATVPAVLGNQVDWDKNALEISTQATAFSWPDVSGRSFSAWQAAGRDVHSVALTADPVFNQGSYAMPDWALARGVGSTFDSVWQTLRARQEGVWGPFYDAASCFKAFAVAYTATDTSVPAIDNSGLGYFGVTDNRVLTPSTGGPTVYMLKFNHGSTAFRLTGI